MSREHARNGRNALRWLPRHRGGCILLPMKRRRYNLVISQIVIMIAGACAGRPRVTPVAPAPAVVIESGTASWYGPGFNGKATASGEIYDQNALTAAHKTLALGTRVRVTNLQNGRSVDVRINDRGPFVGNRIIDLSYAAAKSIDMVDAGIAQVRLEMLSGAPTTAMGSPSEIRFTIQIGSFTQSDAAARLAERARATSADVSVVTARAGGVTYFRVQVGAYRDRDAADVEARRLKQAGFDTLVTTK
jgi:rare lipoprotein A